MKGLIERIKCAFWIFAKRDYCLFFIDKIEDGKNGNPKCYIKTDQPVFMKMCVKYAQKLIDKYEKGEIKRIDEPL